MIQTTKKRAIFQKENSPSVLMIERHLKRQKRKTSMIDSMQYTQEVKRAIQIAQSIAREYQNALFSPAHLLKAILHNEVGLASYLSVIGEDIHYLRDWADIRIESEPKATTVPEEPIGNKQVSIVMETADVVRLKLSEQSISPLCLLIAMSKPNIAFTKDQLKSFPIVEETLLKARLEDISLQEAIMPSTDSTNGKSTAPANQKIKALHKFCIDKTALAREGKIDPIIGRDKEIRTISEILGRRTKPNVIVVGEPGVGKTALIDGFALDIVNGKVPNHLKSAIVFELDVGSLIAGASYKGEVEDRLKNIIKEVKLFEKAILFVDEIHTLMDKMGGASGAANLLKPELARGELTVLGATTLDEYREHIEADEAFSRRFEVVKVEEPDIVTAVRMIKTLMPFYETHHEIKVQEDAIWESVRLSKRYIKERRLPDAAIDLMDRTMSAIKMMDETSEETLQNLDETLTNFSDEEKGDLAELQWFYKEFKNKLSPVLFNKLEDETEPEQIEEAVELMTYLNKTLDALKTFSKDKKEGVEKSDIAAVVSHKTGIPLGKIQTQEREKLLQLEDALKKRVVGQDHALKSLAEAIRESRSGLTKAGQPIGSFFLMGPTGTGKTELAKSVAEFLFNDENTLLRFDMSEFKEEHSAALLYGAPPGYVGYKEGGLLVNKIRQQPYSVVLFDEIEKAHPSVFDVFLQILDEGKLHDRLGKEGDFSNSIILFTSNIGSEFVAEKFDKKEMPKNSDMMDIMSRHFRPEFLARLTEIVPFAPISEEVVELIFDIHLQKLLNKLHKQGITLEVTPDARKHLALSGFTPKYGARPLQGVIRNQIRRPISRMIISGKAGKGTVLNLGINEEKEIVWGDE